MGHPEHDSIPLDALPEAIRKFVDPKSPPPIRMMAAKAMAPLGPLELATAIVQLRLDSDAGVRTAADESFKTLPDEILDSVVARSDAHPNVIDAFARKLKRDEARLQKIALNKSILDETLVYLASIGSENLTETIAVNHVRLLAEPRIVESLYLNTNARMSTLNKLLELCRREGVKLNGIPALQAALESEDFDPMEQSTGGDADFNAVLAAVDETEDKEDKDLERFLEREDPEAEPAEEGEKKRQSEWQKIQQMTASEKIRLAVTGGRSMRKILIRDTKKIVSMAAIQSPKVTPGEVQGYAGNRSLSDGVIAYIVRKREWVRYYPVIVALANNPKTPLSESMGLLKMLRVADLRNIQRNKNIPSQLSRQARNLYRNKGKDNK